VESLRSYRFFGAVLSRDFESEFLVGIRQRNLNNGLHCSNSKRVTIKFIFFYPFLQDALKFSKERLGSAQNTRDSGQLSG
jgi:hypothetical protein